jgi:hypothetical protein
MNMKRMILGGFGTLVLGAALWHGLGTTPAMAAASGADLFAEYKCAMCHSVAGADIQATVKSEKMKGPDLGGYKNADSAELLSFVTQATDRDGAKHKKKFPGGQEELDSILAWLGEQKAAE